MQTTHRHWLFACLALALGGLAGCAENATPWAAPNEDPLALCMPNLDGRIDAAELTSHVGLRGRYQRSLGPLAVEQIRNFRAQHAILTVGALDGASIMDFDLQEAEIARAMIERSERVTIVADHSKLGRKAVFDVATLGRIARLITDAPPPPALSGVLAQAGVEVIVASA